MATAAELKKQRRDAKTTTESGANLADIDLAMAILKAYGGKTEDELKEIKDKITKEGLEAVGAEMDEAMSALGASPEGQARIQAVVEARKDARLSTKYAPFFQAALAGGDIASAIGQINQAKREGSRLIEPGMPPVPNLDPAISQNIAEAQRGTYDQSRAIAPARQELQDQYAKDIALAKQIGGGQSSTLGALGQVASMRRARGAASLLPAVDAIRAREQSRLDNLIGQRSGLLDQNYRNRFYQYRGLQDQYNRDATAIGALGSAGRMNLRSSAQNLLNAVPGVAARVGSTSGFNDPVSQYENELNMNLTNPRKDYTRPPIDYSSYDYINNSPI